MTSTQDPESQAATIVAELRAFVAEWFRGGSAEGLEPDTPLVTSGIIDSAGILEVVEFLEQRFGIAVDDADVTVGNCNSLAALAGFVQRKLG